MDSLDEVVEGLGDAVEFVAVQRADEAVVVHVEFLRDAVVAQFREGVDDGPGDHVQQQDGDHELLGHHEEEGVGLHRRSVRGHVDRVAHSAAVLQPEVQRLQEAETHLRARRVHHLLEFPIFQSQRLETFQFVFLRECYESYAAEGLVYYKHKHYCQWKFIYVQSNRLHYIL